MLATPGALPTGPEWVYEVKWDGMRLLADVADGVLHLHTRGGRDVTASFPELAGLTEVAPDVLLDGEVVLLESGVPSFAALAERLQRPLPRPSTTVTYMAFDVLRLYGVPIAERPLHDRRATLERLDIAAIPTVALSPLYTDGRALFEATVRRGMEGVVAKRRDSPYGGPGWVTVTHRHTQTCLVGGRRPGRGVLLLGVPDGDGLAYVGRVTVGSAERTLSDLLTGAERASSPFDERPPRADAAGAHWCEPVVAVEVAHQGWTPAGRLREPVFRGVRADVEPGDVRREG